MIHRNHQLHLAECFIIIQLVKELPALHQIQSFWTFFKSLSHEFTPHCFLQNYPNLIWLCPVVYSIWEDHNCKCKDGNNMPVNRQAFVWGTILTLVRRKRGQGRRKTNHHLSPKHTHMHIHKTATFHDNTHTRYRYIMTGSKVGLFDTESDLFGDIVIGLHQHNLEVQMLVLLVPYITIHVYCMWNEKLTNMLHIISFYSRTGWFLLHFVWRLLNVGIKMWI